MTKEIDLKELAATLKTRDPNAVQVGGDHYRLHGTSALQHWDIVEMFGLGYFEGNATKYLFRWKNKGGLQDLYKARHYIDKLINLEEAKQSKKDPGGITEVRFVPN